MDDIVKRLRALAVAYPEDVFPPPPPGEHGKTVDQCSAAMGRHFSSVFTEVADEIERLRGEYERGKREAFEESIGLVKAWVKAGDLKNELLDIFHARAAEESSDV